MRPFNADTMPAPRLRVANVRFLLLSLLLVVGVVLWRACAAPTPHAASTPQHSALAVEDHVGDEGRRQSASRASTNDAAAFESVAEAAPQPTHIADAEAVLARIEAERRPGQHDEPTDALEIRALVSLDRIGASHAKLQHFAERYPTSSELPALVRLTGYHPRPMSRAVR